MSMGNQEIARRLQHLNEYDFELFIAELWERRGWDTEVTSGSNDKGIDVIATQSVPYQEKEIIQAKRYRPGNRVGSPEIQQYASLNQQERDADKVIVVSTSGFTDRALSIAEETNVKCIDGATLAEIVAEHDATDIVRQFTEPVDEQENVSVRSRSSQEKKNDREHEKKDGKRTIVERGDDLTVELVGMKRVETTVSSGSVLPNEVTLNGVIIAMELYNQKNDSIPIEYQDAFEFIDDEGGTYTPVNMGAGEFNNGWKKHGGRTSFNTLWVEPGSMEKYAVGVSLPDSSKISEITLERYGITFDLDYKDREQLPDLPQEIKSGIGD